MYDFSTPTSAQIYCGDALAFLSTLECNSATIVFNLGKNYGPRTSDNLPPIAYQTWLQEVLAEAVRVLSPGGALYLYHLPVWAMTFGEYLKRSLDLRHWIAISMKNGFARGARLYPAHYALLYFTKGSPAFFERPRLPVDRCECGRLKKSYGGYRAIVEEKGINLSDVWDDLSPVRHAARKRRGANELPSKLTQRVILMSGIAGGLFVDPFAGAGAALLAAAQVKMKTKACDIVRSNCTLQASTLRDAGFS